MGDFEKLGSFDEWNVESFVLNAQQMTHLEHLL